MQLRVFADSLGAFYLEISSPSLSYDRRLFVPMVARGDTRLRKVDERTLVTVRYAGSEFKVPYLLIHSRQAALGNWSLIGEIDENDSRNVLNHILDILAWD